MADKAITELVLATQITPSDLFVLEQSGTAKALSGQVLLNWLTKAADGHGGISSIQKVEESGLLTTYRITLADTTIFDFVVSNGRGIQTIQKTGTAGLVDTYTVSYNDGSTSTFTVTNGAKGDKGDNTYLWIKYASQEPTAESHSFGDVPDSWIGVYYGSASTAPTSWSSYRWYQIKGEQGDVGIPATLQSSDVEYQVSAFGDVIPSGSWSANIPTVPQGSYLWTRVCLVFNTGSPVYMYSVSRAGRDGLGSVVSVCNVSPDTDGNIALTAADLGALSTRGGTMEGAIAMGGNKVTGLGTPTANTDAATKAYVDGKHFSYSVDLEVTGWSSVGGIYQKDVAITGLLSTDTVFVDLFLADDITDANTIEELEEEYSKIYGVYTGDGVISVRAKEVPTVKLTFMLRVVR